MNTAIRSLSSSRTGMLITLLVVSCFSGSLFAQETGQDGRHAVLIGIHQYDPEQLVPLPSAEGEMAKLQELLLRGGYLDTQVSLYTNTSGSVQSSLLPTKRNIVRKLEQLSQELQRTDSLILSFSGHGLVGTDGQWYLCPLDADLLDAESLLPLTEVYQHLNQIRCGHKLVLLDAMHDQPFADSLDRVLASGFSHVVPTLPAPPSDCAVMVSAAVGQSSVRPATGSQAPSRFFDAVIDGLQGQAAGADGSVTLPDLERFVKSAFAQQPTEHLQQPILENNTTGLLTLMSFSLGMDEMEKFQWYIRADRYDEAEAIVDRRLATRPEDAIALAQKSRLLTYRAEQFRVYDRVDEAWQIADRAIQLAPNESLPYIARSNAYRIKQEYEKALADATTAVQRDPNNVMAHVIRGFCCHHLHDLEGMRREAEVGIELDPEFPEARATLVAYLFAKGRLPEGMQELDRAIAIAPDMAALYFLKGYGYEKQRQHREAVAQYSLAIQCNDQIPGYYCRRALSQVNAGNVSGALADIAAAEKIMPDYVDIAAARTMVNQKQRGYGKSGDLIVEGLKQNPRSADLWQGRGFDLYNNRRYSEALEAFTKCLEINPGYGEAHMGMGMVFVEQQNYEEALVHLNRATRHKPHLARAYFEKSRVYMAQRDLAQASAEIELALQYDPNDQAYRIQKATIARSQP